MPATAIGMGLGLLLGAVTVGYGTSLADLALMGALTGLVLGPAQALALPRGTRLRWVWAAAMPALWALGWTATTLGGIAVDEQFTVFGAYGAITFSALSGLLLLLLLPDRPAAGSPPAPAPVGATRMTAAPRHVIFGTGAIGLAVLDALRRRGETARLVNRSGHARVPDDVEVVGGDARDPAFTTDGRPRAPASSTRRSTRPTPSGPPSSRCCRPACSPPPRPPAPGWSAWRTSTCTGAPPAGR